MCGSPWEAVFSSTQRIDAEAAASLLGAEWERPGHRDDDPSLRAGRSVQASHILGSERYRVTEVQLTNPHGWCWSE